MTNQVAVFEEFPWGDVIEVIPYEKVDMITGGNIFNILVVSGVAIGLYLILKNSRLT